MTGLAGAGMQASANNKATAAQQAANAQAAAAGIGTASPGWEGKYGAKLLLAGVNFEEYGLIYKCTYTVRLNNEGWPEAVYPLAGADIT